jgi:hypothetical protein
MLNRCALESLLQNYQILWSVFDLVRAKRLETTDTGELVV